MSSISLRSVKSLLNALIYLVLLFAFAVVSTLTVEEGWQWIGAYPPLPRILVGAVITIALAIGFTHLVIKVRRQHSSSAISHKRFRPLVLLSPSRPTYIQFLWLGLTLSLMLLVSCAGIVNRLGGYIGSPALGFYAATYLGTVSEWILIPLSLGIAIFSVLLYADLSCMPIAERGKRFAPRSVATVNDGLKFAARAAAEMKMALTGDEAMRLVVLDGGRGMGKSSFLRMMIESVEDKDTLYAYISLTETDRKTSFSKLFAQRWAEALCNRYPTFYFGAGQAILENIARETGNGWLSLVLSFCKDPRWPLRQTKAVLRGDNHKEDIVPPATAALFGYIPEFAEKYMIVVVDEVERAKFSEIYQALEIIERFRYESQWGLPIKLVFFICVDRDYLLQERCSGDDANGVHQERKLIEGFFENNKLIDRIVPLPLVDPSTRQNFIVDKIQKIIDAYGINTESLGNHGLKPQYSKEDANPFKQADGHTRWDDKMAYDFMFWRLMESTPREIDKILIQADILLKLYLQGGPERSPDQIRFSDLVLFTYAKNHPLFINFLVEVMPLVFEQDMSILDEETRDLNAIWREQNNEKPPKFDVLFKRLMGSRFDESDVERINVLIAALCYPVILYTTTYSREYNDTYKHVYDRTLGLYENLRDVMDLATNASLRADSSYLETQAAEIIMNEQGIMPPDTSYDGEELLKLSRNIRRYYSGDFKASWVLAQEIVTRMVQDKLPVEPGKLATAWNSTIYDQLTYQFLFHFTNYLKRDVASVDDGFRLLEKLLQSKQVLVEAKLRILYELFAHQESKTAIDYDFQRAREKLEERFGAPIKLLVKQVISSSIKRYAPKTCKVIYDCEENFFYVLYGLWDGENNTDTIRQIALKTLETRPDMIQKYWQRENEYKPMAPRGFEERQEFPIRARDLIEVTRKADLEDQYSEEIGFLEKLEHEGKIKAPDPPTMERATITQLLKYRGYSD